MALAIGANIEKPSIPVRHSELRRAHPESAYKSDCPRCSTGMLLVARHLGGFLCREDRCTICGQRVTYTDEKINGEGFLEVGQE